MLSGLSRQKVATGSQNAYCGIGLGYGVDMAPLARTVTEWRQSEARLDRCS